MSKSNAQKTRTQPTEGLSVLPQWLYPSLTAFFFMLSHTFLNQIGDFYHQPWSQPHSHEVSQSKLEHVLGPQRLKVIGQAYFTTPVHLCCFSVKFRNSNLWSSNGVCDRMSHLMSDSWRSWMYQHFPKHRVPSLLDSSWNQSLSTFLLSFTYQIRDRYSSLSCCTHNSRS